jgi:hypothetical protein
MTVTHHLCIFYGIEGGQVELGCDGASALNTTFEKDPVLNSDTPDFDLVGAIYQLRKTLKVLWRHRHVKGHQDESSVELDDWALCNVSMDKKAKLHLSMARFSPRHFSIEGEPWQLWVKGEKVTQDIQTVIYQAIHEEESKKYWGAKDNIEPSSLKEVDWTAIGKAMRNLPRARRVFVAKHISGMCGVGKFMK